MQLFGFLLRIDFRQKMRVKRFILVCLHVEGKKWNMVSVTEYLKINNVLENIVCFV